MKEQTMNEYHEANRRRWAAAAAEWEAMHERRGTWKVAHEQPELVFIPQEFALFGDVAGKQVCVLGSGDNLAVFALAGMGAEVTSVDITQEQLDIAERRAQASGLSVRFVQADVTDLTVLQDQGFDTVYTGGHVAVWVSDLRAYYAEAIRILKPGGLFLINEYHPFRRVWRDASGGLILEFGYFDRRPHYYEVPEGLFDNRPGTLPSYEFHWTVSDFLKAVMEQGCDLLAVEEIGEESEGWEIAPLQGLPQMLLIAGRKR